MQIKTAEEAVSRLRQRLRDIEAGLHLVRVINVCYNKEKGSWEIYIMVSRGFICRLLRRYERYKVEISADDGSIISFMRVPEQKIHAG